MLFRTSDIGFGYPNIEELLGYANYTPQKIAQALILLCLIIYLFFFPQRIRGLRLNSLNAYILTVTVVMSVLFSNHFFLSARYLLSFLVVLLPVVLFINVYGVAKLVTIVTRFLFYLLLVSIAYVILFPQYGIMGGNHSGAYRGMFIHKNVFGFFCVLTSIFCLFSYLTETARGRKRYIILYAICAIATFKSLSTTSIVLFLFALIGFVFFHSVYLIKGTSLRLVLYYSFVIFISIFLLMFSVYFEDITYALGKDPTLTGRTELWEILIFIGFDRPIFGHGFGLFFRPEIMHDYSAEFGWDAKSAHNSYLDLYLGLGVMGLSSFLWILISRIVSYPRARKLDYSRLLSITGIIVIMCFGFSESGAFLGTGLVSVLLVIFIYSFSTVNHQKYCNHLINKAVNK